MILVLTIDIDAPIDQEYALNEEQKRLLREFEKASDVPAAGVQWFTTSEETLEKMMEV